MTRQIHVPLLPFSDQAVLMLANVLERAVLAEITTDDAHRRILAMNPTLARQITRDAEERTA